ncbi:MAG: adenylate/guanylate cyclase domain-containing protein [Clostridiales bacterium]|nr:adenylate/guanylate cyclase domain-containing protein [Clostridiales bacterium]
MKADEVLKTAVTTAVIIIIVTVLSYMDIMKIWDRSMLDVMTQSSSGVNPKIFIVGIDDKTLEKYGMISGWGRELSGKLVEKLNENPGTEPAVIGLDIIYSENADKEGDIYFAKACENAGNIVAASNLVFKEQPQKNEAGDTIYNPYNVDYSLKPYQELSEYVDTGFVNTVIDSDGYVRQAMTDTLADGEEIYSFDYQIYKKYQEARGEEAELPKTYGRGNLFYFSYSGKPGAYTVISMADVLDDTVDTRIFDDSIVLVGSYAVGMQDSIKPAIAHDTEMYGVECHANIIQAFLEGKTQIPVSKGLYALLTGCVCGAFFLFAKKRNMLWLTITLFGCIFGNILVVKVMYDNGYILPVLFLPVVFVLIYMQQLIQGYVTERIRRRRVINVLKQYVSPQVVDKISKDKNFELMLGGENRHVAILFVDIRGFTTMSESMEPEQIVEILNEYLSLTTECIFKYNGTLDKYVGDTTMAVFNAPFDLDDYIFRAVCAAWDMKQGAGAIAQKMGERFGKPVTFGIGVNCGNAVVGNIGCDFRMDYTAIGDTVNTAARLENNAKPGQILISEQVYETVKDRIEATRIGEIPLKGKNKRVCVYQLDNVIRKQ